LQIEMCAILIHPKKLRKALLPCSSLPKQTGATCYERRRDRLKFLKAIMIVAVLASALSLGACAQHKEEVTTGAGTTGYAK
jgi:hypothetical protein